MNWFLHYIILYYIIYIFTDYFVHLFEIVWNWIDMCVRRAQVHHFGANWVANCLHVVLVCMEDRMTNSQLFMEEGPNSRSSCKEDPKLSTLLTCYIAMESEKKISHIYFHFSISLYKSKIMFFFVTQKVLEKELSPSSTHTFDYVFYLFLLYIAVPFRGKVDQPTLLVSSKWRLKLERYIKISLRVIFLTINRGQIKNFLDDANELTICTDPRSMP